MGELKSWEEVGSYVLPDGAVWMLGRFFLSKDHPDYLLEYLPDLGVVWVSDIHTPVEALEDLEVPEAIKEYL